MPATPNGPEPPHGLRSLGRALVHRNYRLFFGGQGISLIGTWMTRVATYWLIFRLGGEDREMLLGLTGFAGQAPTFFLAPFSGAVVDHTNRQRMLIVTQAASLVQSALLAVVAFWGAPGSLTIAVILVLALFQGIINAFDMPARQAFLVEMVTRKEDLANAIALNSSLVNGSRLVGPTLAGLLIYGIQKNGEGWCFVVDAVSYVAVILALLAMDVAPRPAGPARPALVQSIREGFRYAFGFAPIRALLLLSALVSLMAWPYSVLLPVFAKQLRPDAGAQAYGFLSAAAGVGALVGALYLAARRTVLGLGRVIIFATVVLGLGLIAFAWSPIYLLSLALLILVGLGMMVQMAASNTILQTIVEEDKRGRVMSLYSMAFLGMTPFGSLLAGALAARTSAALTLTLGGAVCLIGAAVFALKLPQLRKLVRPLYARMGILPEMAQGLGQAAELARAPEQ
jgi:MFS family permease